MLKRKLIALEHHDPKNFNIDDEQQFRGLVVWLEEQKIRQYKIEDREELRKINSDNWPQTLNLYLNELNCPIKNNRKIEILDWLLGQAVCLEYEDNIDKFSNVKSADVVESRKSQPKVVYSNPLDNIDYQSEEFKAGVNDLAKLLHISQHPDHLITLSAVCKLVKERLSPEALANPDSVTQKGMPFPYESVDEGLEGSEVVNKATKMLRLLFLHDLRDLQTEINECIVAVQNLTANPKTDTSLGKVGH